VIDDPVCKTSTPGSNPGGASNLFSQASDVHTNVNSDERRLNAELIRNAFAHDPFNPVWRITPETQDQEFEVRDVLTRKTTGLIEWW
jgi:hypothetical protein